MIVTAVRWYLRFRLSAADVRDLLAERGVDVSARTVLNWVQKFAPLLARAHAGGATRDASELERSQYAQSAIPHYRPFGHRLRTADARFSAIGAANPHFYADSACIVQSSTEF